MRLIVDFLQIVFVLVKLLYSGNTNFVGSYTRGTLPVS